MPSVLFAAFVCIAQLREGSTIVILNNVELLLLAFVVFVRSSLTPFLFSNSSCCCFFVVVFMRPTADELSRLNELKPLPNVNIWSQALMLVYFDECSIHMTTDSINAAELYIMCVCVD